MRTLKTSEAAALLNVSPNTLRAWERRFGYPKPQRSAGRHRLYTHGEVAALRDALQQGLSISSAVSRAREALSTDTHTLVGALAGFELDRADSAMESALALRSVERSVEEVLLPSLDELGERFGTDSAPWAFAARWADGWLRRAQRLAPPPVRRLAILVGDATRNELDPDALAVRAFELFCGRSGARVMALPVGSVSGLSDVVASLSPDAVVIAGSHLPDDDVALWAYRVRATAGPAADGAVSQLPPGRARAHDRHADPARRRRSARIASCSRSIDDRQPELERDGRAAGRCSRPIASAARHRHEAPLHALRPVEVDERGLELVSFCGHCGQRPDPPPRRRPRASAGTAGWASSCRPTPISPRARDEPFLIVDTSLSVCAMSAAAETAVRDRRDRRGQQAHRRLPRAGRRQRAERREPARAARRRRRRARGEPCTTVVRPRQEFGVRFWARIGPCGSPRAALLVLS